MELMHGVHLQRLELTQLRLLGALHETGSITRAAEKVGLTQPAASHSLSRLRTVLADPLFVRTSRGMEPTPYGEAVCATVREALATLRRGFESGRGFDPLVADRTFCVYMSDVGQLIFLPRLLAHLRVHAPNVRVRVSPMPSREHGTALERGEVDLAVGHITTMSTGFHQRLLFHEHYVCAASMDNARFSKGMTLKAFNESRHAIADSSGMAHWVVDRELARHGIVREAALIVPEFMTLPFLIPGSDLVVTMPSRLAQQFTRLVPLRVMAPPVPFASFEIRLFWHERAHRDEANRWFRQTLVSLFQKLEGPPKRRPPRPAVPKAG
jgi:DNA-binding transcriptional LysR family regulator